MFGEKLNDAHSISLTWIVHYRNSHWLTDQWANTIHYVMQ